MRSSSSPKAGLQEGVQEATWSFPTQAASSLLAAIVAPATSFSDETTAAIADVDADVDVDVDADVDAKRPSTLSPDNGSPQNNQPITDHFTPPAASPSKTTKKSRKRKATDPDGEYKTSTNNRTKKKKKNNPSSTSTSTNQKPNRKSTSAYNAESTYLPTTKITLEPTIDDEIDNDADICHDDCEEKDEQDMIHCDGEACRLGGKWFHTKCVGFGGRLPANINELEWYCEICRGEMGFGEESAGLVHRAEVRGGGDGEVDVHQHQQPPSRRLRSGSGN